MNSIFKLDYLVKIFQKKTIVSNLGQYFVDNFEFFEKVENNIEYKNNTFLLSNKDKVAITKLLEMHKPVFRIKITSSASTMGSKDYNLDLSKKRAIEIENFIKKIDHKIVVEKYYLGEKESKEDDISFQKSIIQLLPKIKRNSSDIDSNLLNRMAELIELDQKYRIILDSVMKSEMPDSSYILQLGKLMNFQDSLNRVELDKIISKVKIYPGLSLIGGEHMDDAFFIIHHGPLEYRLKYNDLLHKAADQCEFNLSSMALFIDRNLIDQGKNQLYGTQCAYDQKSKKFVPMTIEDPKNVNQRRSSMRLGTLEEYLKFMNN